MKKIANRDARDHVSNLIEFNGNNTFARNVSGVGYVVYSYGAHWILYLFDGNSWYGCSDKRSVSTSKQASQLYPVYNEVVEMTQAELQKICN